MPALDAKNPGVPAVARAGALLSSLLDEASVAKKTSDVEPALNPSDFENITGRVTACLAGDAAPGPDNGANNAQGAAAKTRQFAVIETAARDLFVRLIAATPIESPDFVKMWNLLDILSILSDNGQCDPALLFWLVEELLDSQTIAGCRKIFDYLESRRERITAKHFKQKNLVILRSCNELLRRLSRAEDTAFCGRVFIFMFQSFPLGDRSSVNLRGEFHVENVTNYETRASSADGSKMDTDAQDPTDSQAADVGAASSGPNKTSKPFDLDSLYTSFWSLQESFSQPLKLFDPAHLAQFKSNLEATMKAFEAIHNGEVAHSSKSAESMKRESKRRKEEDVDGDGLETFNPKYLTSKDLFELEINDLSLRRPVLVQALIVIDFVLSLSADAKEKTAGVNASNKSVTYSDRFDEDNTKWANDMKTTISDYLKRGSDGPHFYRMVETVLARDKNWVHWKMASCPPIQREPVSSEVFNEAKTSAQRLATSKRLRPTPMGAVPMDFLRDDFHTRSMEARKAPERYQLPDLESFKKAIADEDFEIANPTNEQTKADAVARKASKTWLALRLASGTKMAAFDKIDDTNDISAIFEELSDPDESSDDEMAGVEDMPQNREPVIVAGPPGADRRQLVERLMQLHPGVFGAVVRHAAREPREGEVRARTFHFVTQLQFNQLRDGDGLLEHGAGADGVDTGTSLKAVDRVLEAGKVPVIGLDVEAARFARDMDFAARYVLVDAAAAGAGSADADAFDKRLVGADPAQLAEQLAAYIFAGTADDGGE